MAQRIRGQETIITIIADGLVEGEIDSIVSSEFTHNIDLQEDNFLGRTSPDFDMIFKGTAFNVQGQLSNPSALRLFDKIIAKAQRQADAAVRIDITSTFIFATGTYTIAFEDCSFGSIPVTTGGREEFTNFTLEGSCSQGVEVT